MIELPPAPVPDWYPDHASWQKQPPEPGQLLAFQHAAYRVIEVRQIPETKWTDEQRDHHDMIKPEYRWRAGAIPVAVAIRPVAITSDDPKVRRADRHVVSREWWVYRDEHYPVCAVCGEPAPCRDRLGKQAAEQAMAGMARYEQPGVCPSCGEVVTTRQKSWTWPENLEIPGGPPVTFHVGRLGCRWAAAAYDKRWVAADPEQRTPRWYCPGRALTHNDGTYQCTVEDACPGPLAEHEAFTVCSCGGCRARGSRVDSRPAASATRRTRNWDETRPPVLWPIRRPVD